MVHDTRTRSKVKSCICIAHRRGTTSNAKKKKKCKNVASRRVIHALQILSASVDSLTVYWVQNMFTQSWRLVINCVSKMCLTYTFSLKVGHNIYSVKFGENWPSES